MCTRASLAALLCSLALGAAACVAPPPTATSTKKKTASTEDTGTGSTACGPITQRGICEIRGTTPAIARVCSPSGDKLLSDDCTSHGLVCTVDPSLGATCVSASQAPTSGGTGSTPTGSSPNTACGTITAKGTCSGTVMKWCGTNNKLSTTDCAFDAGYTCKMLNGEAKCAPTNGSTPTPPKPPTTGTSCGTLTASGQCNGTKIAWCSASGTKLESDCAYDAGYTCKMVNGEAKCVDTSAPASNCGSIPETGTCSGSVMKWCYDGRILETIDCAWDGMDCAMVSGEASCVYPNSGGTGGGNCGSVTSGGSCNGTMKSWCYDGDVETIDCAWDGMVCEMSGGAASCVYPSGGGTGGGGNCGSVTTGGSCSGTMKTWCYDGDIETIDCAWDGLVCRMIGGMATCDNP